MSKPRHRLVDIEEFMIAIQIDLTKKITIESLKKEETLSYSFNGKGFFIVGKHRVKHDTMQKEFNGNLSTIMGGVVMCKFRP